MKPLWKVLKFFQLHQPPCSEVEKCAQLSRVFIAEILQIKEETKRFNGINANFAAATPKYRIIGNLKPYTRWLWHNRREKKEKNKDLKQTRPAVMISMLCYENVFHVIDSTSSAIIMGRTSSRSSSGS